MNSLKRTMSVLLAVLVVGGGFVALGAPAALAAPLTQDGPVNYIGPGPCPTDATDCTIATGDINVVQSAPTSGRSEVDCRGVNCVAVQTGTTTADKPQNTAACANSTTAAASDQRCDLRQTGGTNTINANFSAAPSTGSVVNLANVTQSSKQRFATSQDGSTNTLNVKGSITQTANSALDATTPVSHNQQTLIASNNTMTATVANVADYALTRSQTSTASGATPTQLQDNAAGSEPDGAVIGLGAVRLVAKSAGTNSIKVRGTDTKKQTTTSLNLGQATQQQGNSSGGWLVDLSGSDSGVANAGGAPDVDIGTPGTQNGLVKDWTQTASGILGGAIAKDQDQIDKINIPIIGQSPFTVSSSALNKLTTDAGGHQVCEASAVGHAKTVWNGSLACDMHAGTKAKNPAVTFSSQNVDASVACEQNTDTCPGATLNPVSHAHQAVRNVTTGGSYSGDDAPASASAAPNDVVEYRSIFHNAGAGSATGATLKTTVPANTTFVSCSDACSGPTGGVVTWGLGTVSAGAALPRTVSVKVNSGVTAGTTITNKATGADAQEAPFDSQTTTVTVTAPRAKTVQIKIFGADQISGTIPVGILSAADFDARTIVPSSVCFGDPDDPARPPTGRDCTAANGGTSLVDVNNDGRVDLKMHFEAAETGIDANDKTACASGFTTDGTYFEGCGALPKG